MLNIHLLLSLLSLYLLASKAYSNPANFILISISNSKNNVSFDALVNDYKKGSILVKRTCVKKLGSYKKKEGVGILISALAHGDYELSFYSKQSLIKLNVYALPYIFRSLDKKGISIKLRAELIKIIGSIRDSKGVYPLLRLIENEKSPIIRALSIESLGLIGSSVGLDYIIKSLVDRDYRVRANSAKALGLINNDRAIVPLIKAIGDNNNFVRINAAWSLGRLRSKSAVPFLIKFLGKGNAEARETIAWALGRISDKRAIKPLLYTLIKDPSLSVRREARHSLKAFGFSSSYLDSVAH